MSNGATWTFPPAPTRVFTRVLAVLFAVSIAAALLAASASAEALESVSAVAISPSLVTPAIPSRRVALTPRVENPAAYRAAKRRALLRLHEFEARRAATTTAPTARPRTQVFGGLNAPGLDAFSGGGATPPDTTGAIGPANYLEMVNSEIAVYSRTTLEPEESLAEATFAGSADSTCDGQIQWDEQGQRWLYAVLDCGAPLGAQKFFFGWSKTPSPELASSNWCRFALPTGHSLEDYPKLGHDDTQILVGTNAFDDEEEEYEGSHIWVAPKPAPGVTECPAPPTVGKASAEFTPVPANLADASPRGYVTALKDLNHLVLYEVGKNGENKDAILRTTTVTVPAFDFPAPVPQPGTPDAIDSSDTRLTQAVATTDPKTGEEGIWTQHTVAGAGGGPSVVRWYELSPGKTTPRQTGSVAGPGGTFAFNGAVSPAANGEDAAVFFNSGDGSHLVDLRARDRHGASPLGSTGGEILLGTSVAADEDFSCEGGFFACRWGDYAGASPDPNESAVVWGTGELTTLPFEFEEPQWGSQNAALDLSVPNLPPSASTAPASSIGQLTATLNGAVDPQGRETKYHFEFGTTAAYGSSTAEASIGPGIEEAVPVSAAIGGLAASTTYHFRLVATNSVNTTQSADRTFTTASPPSPGPSPRPKPLKCRRGFKKRRVHGKLRCVRVKRHHHHRHHHVRR